VARVGPSLAKLTTSGVIRFANNKFQTMHWRYLGKRVYNSIVGNIFAAFAVHLGGHMKTLALIFLLVISSQNAFAGVCQRVVDARMSEEFASKNWEYFGVNTIQEARVWNLLETSGEFTEVSRDAIRTHLEQDGNEFYVVAGNGNYSSTFEELIVVSRSNCRILNRAIFYVE
jgi:hypothetical protein